MVLSDAKTSHQEGWRRGDRGRGGEWSGISASWVYIWVPWEHGAQWHVGTDHLQQKEPAQSPGCVHVLGIVEAWRRLLMVEWLTEGLWEVEGEWGPDFGGRLTVGLWTRCKTTQGFEQKSNRIWYMSWKDHSDYGLSGVWVHTGWPEGNYGNRPGERALWFGPDARGNSGKRPDAGGILMVRLTEFTDG